MFYEVAKEIRDIIEQSIIKNETRCVTSNYTTCACRLCLLRNEDHL